ncbi:hypothetical protein Tco_1199524 [Tanacetum coccineum]
MARRLLGWKVVEHVSHKKFSNGGVIMVEDDPDVIHVDNSSDLALSISLNDLEIAALQIDGQSIDVDLPPDIIDVVDEDDDIIDKEDLIPHDLADSDDEDLVNLDIGDGVNIMLYGVTTVTVAVMIVPLHTRYPPIVEVAWATEVRAPENPIWVAGKRAGCIPARRPGTSVIQQHLQKIYNGMKAALKERYCIPDSDGTYDLERIRQTRPSHISEVNWDAQIAFWNDPKNLARLPK